MTITQRDVRRLQEAQEFAQQAIKEYEALRLRDGLGEATKEKAKEAAAAWGEADARCESLRKQIERTEDVRL
jgi:hypothetical protein